MLPEDSLEEFPLSDAIDHLIVMHRDAHFGGNFDIMLDYYERQGKGVSPEFEISRILELQGIEKQLQRNLGGLLLSGAEAERVAESHEAYKKLRSLYEKKALENVATQYPRLIADLILSEEEEPTAEIEAIVAEKRAIIPSLLELLRSDDFYDPLFPGYGFGPTLAAKCLGIIGDPRAIATLFESLGESDFAFENLTLKALKAIGEPSKKFLLKVVHAKPITYDNERAAMALLQFKDDPEVVQMCFEILKGLDLNQHIVLATYLILACEGLKDANQRREFETIAKSPKSPKMLQPDFRTILEHWKNNKCE